MISCILLTAGNSSRFGSPKALALLNNTTNVITRLQNTLLATQVHEVIVVLGAHSEKIKPSIIRHKKIKSTVNQEHQLGQTSSFKTGLQMVSNRSLGVMLLPVDCPFIQAQTIDRLIREFIQTNPHILIPTYHKKNGHPPIFNVSLVPALLQMDNSMGLNSYQKQSNINTFYFEIDDEWILKSFNTSIDFERLKKEYSLEHAAEI